MDALGSCCREESASPQAARQNPCEVTNAIAGTSQGVATGISFLASTLATAGSSVSDGAPVTSGRTVGRSVPSSVSGIRQPTRLSDSDRSRVGSRIVASACLKKALVSCGWFHAGVGAGEEFGLEVASGCDGCSQTGSRDDYGGLG